MFINDILCSGMTLFNNGISRDPHRHKGEMIRHVVSNADLIITAGYGSSRDVPIYQSIHVLPDHIFVVGKSKSRLQSQAQFISDGYALHLGIVFLFQTTKERERDCSFGSV